MGSATRRPHGSGGKMPAPAFPGRAAFLLLAAALSLPAAVGGDGRGIRFQRVSLEQGLSQATVTAILQDRTGFLWLGTQDGLNRYDGNDFVVLTNDPDDPATLTNNWILALREDPSGDIWVGTRGGGLNRWLSDSDTFVSYRHDPDDPESLGDDRVWGLALDGDGALWLGTEQSGLDRFDPSRGVFEHFRHDPADPASLADDQIRALHRDRRGRLWVGTLGGLDLFDPATGGFTHYRHRAGDPTSLSDDQVRSLAEDDSGALWIGTLNGLDRLDPESGELRRIDLEAAGPLGPGAHRIRTLLRDRENRVWTGTDAGLFLFEGGELLSHYRHRPGDSTSLSNDRIMSIFQDRGGVFWIGVLGGGLNKWDERTWAFSNDAVAPADLGSPDVLAFAQDEAGGLWIGTSGGGLSRLDRSSGELTHYRHDPARPDGLSDNRVTALLAGRGGALWIGTLGSGLDRLDPRSGRFTNYRSRAGDPTSLGSDGVISLFEDRDGVLWVGTLGGGLNRFDRTSGTFTRFTSASGDPTALSDDRVSAITQDPDGFLWVGTFGGGVNRLDPSSGRFAALRHDPGDPRSLSNDLVLGLYVAPDGALWAGTQVGLNRLDSLDPATGAAVFRRWFERDGLPSDFIYGILPDEAGRLWLSTNDGLARFDPATETFRNYDASHGLQSNEFNAGAYLGGRGGELFFGGINGYNAFFPDRIQRNEAVPPVVLTAFSKLNQPVRFDRPIFDVRSVELTPGDNVFSVEFAALDYTAPEQNRYRYRLEGFDPDWIDYGNRRRVTFTNLDPGTYTLRVQGSNNDGVWNEEGLSLEVVVLPPFWRTWWFRVLLALAITGLIFLFITLRTRGVRRRNARLQELVAARTRELEEAQGQLLRRERLAVLGELAGSVAHELRNPLGAIKNSAYYLRLTEQLRGEKATEHLGLIEKEIDRSNGIITELLDYGRSPKPRLRSSWLGEIVDAALDAVVIPTEVTVEQIASDGPVAVEVDPDQIERIVVNLVRNACQAMEAGGRLEVRTGARDGSAVITVRDDGPGIPPENLSRIFEPLFTGKAKGIGLGLAVSQRYAQLNGGRIEVESQPGEGATFRIVLPLAAAPAARSVG